MLVLPPSAQAITDALAILAKGGIVAHATETCYGLACDLTNPQAVEKLFIIKNRPSDQPVSVLFPTVAEAKQYVEWNDEAEKLAHEFLPGPLTLILPLSHNAPLLFIKPKTQNQKPVNHQTSKPPNQTLGIRVSSHPLATSLAMKFGKPISTTSANLHGQPNTYCVEEIAAQWKDQNMKPDMIIDSGHLPFTPPSKIIDLTASRATVVRE